MYRFHEIKILGSLQDTVFSLITSELFRLCVDFHNVDFQNIDCYDSQL